MSRAAKLIELKELIAQKEGRFTKDRLPSSTLSCGILKGSLVEISGTAKIEWMTQFLNENPSLKVFWVEKEFSLFPPSLYQHGIDPSRILFAECGDDLFPTLRKALRCQVFECIVTQSAFKEEKILKALQLLSEKASASVFLLTEKLQSSWAISTQLEVHRGVHSKGFEVNLIKNKGAHKIFHEPPKNLEAENS